MFLFIPDDPFNAILDGSAVNIPSVANFYYTYIFGVSIL